MHNNVNNFFFISYDLASDLAFDLDAAMGVVSEGPRKGRRGRETQATRGKGNVRLRGPESPPVRPGEPGQGPEPTARPPARSTMGRPLGPQAPLRGGFACLETACGQTTDGRTEL